MCEMLKRRAGKKFEMKASWLSCVWLTGPVVGLVGGNGSANDLGDEYVHREYQNDTVQKPLVASVLAVYARLFFIWSCLGRTRITTNTEPKT